MSIFYPDNTSSRTVLPASGISSDSNLLLNVNHGGEKSLSLDELKKTGVNVANVKQYGATGDGTTNDYQAIVNAISGSDTIYFPPGTYNIGNNTIYIDAPYGKRIFGNSFADGQTVVKSTASGQPVFRFVCSHWSSLQGMRLFNEYGDGVHWVNCNKASCKDIYAGPGIRDIVFLMNGSQQLYMENCWATSNSTIPSGSSVGAKYGFVWTNYCKISSIVASPNSTGLNGLTLTLAFKASATITIGGNTLQDVVTAINAAGETTGVYAGIAGGTSANRIMLYTRSFDSSTGVNEDRDLVLTDGTGNWSAIGYTAGTLTSGDIDYISNGSMMHNCHGEGMGWVNMFVDGKRLISSSIGGALITVNQCVFQGGCLEANGPAIKAVVVLNYTRNIAFNSVYMENGYVDCMDITNSPYFTLNSSQLQRIKISNSQSVKIIGTTLTRGIEIDSGSEHVVIIGSFVGANEITDNAGSTEYIGVAGANFLSNSAGVVSWAAPNSFSQPINYNGFFEYWNGSTNPIGYTASNATLAKWSAQRVFGTQSVYVTSTGVADGGLSCVLPKVNISHVYGLYSQLNVSFWAQRSTGTSKTFIADASTNTLTASGHGYTTSNAVALLTTGLTPSGTSITTTYWVVNPTTNTFQLSLSPNGSAVDLLSNGSGINYTALIAGSPSVMVTSSYSQRATTTYDIVDEMYPINTWVKKSISFRIPKSIASISVTLIPDLDGTSGSVMLYDGLTISTGKPGPYDYAVGMGESEFQFLNGHYIDYGATAPSGNYYPIGSIRYNTTPSGGGYLGWVCTSGGTPGTWNTFGLIS